MSGGFISSLFRKKADEEEPSKFGLARIIKYEELKKATNSFDTELGNGGFGRVYLGKLRGGRKVAVKVLFDRNPKRLEQFFNEVTVLARLRHKNLVTLYGCTNPRSQELLLVYDYVPNGTVAEHLHGQRSDLNLALRIQIAVETAEALTYLHALEPPIIHRDVKTSNILLDNAFHVKVADLGICRLLPWDSTHVSTVPQGTMGYRDPEYERYFRLSDKTDVYSFGVVLMELMSGQEAVDVNRNPEDIYLDGMAISKIINNKLEEFIDPKLGYHSNNDIRRIINLVIELAGECLQPKGDTRPPMVQVVTALKGIQNEMERFGLNVVDIVSFDNQQELGDGSLGKLHLDQDGEPGCSSASSGGPPLDVLRVIPLAELRRLTGNFGQKALIGEGLYSQVFYATLSSGEPAAIKKLDPYSSQGSDTDFVAQLLTHSKLEHEYFVQLLGYCFESDNRILVYQFAPNGSLHDILYGRRGVGVEPCPILSWSQRVKIAYGAAKGLEYLHEKVQPPIVHQNVISNNVLLFDDYDTKIAYFYSTYYVRVEDPFIKTRWISRSSQHAPEFDMVGELTQKTNVYSFGVILLELLTGRKPVDPTMPKGQQMLVDWARPRLSKERVKSCVDPKLNNYYPIRSVARMAAVAGLCLQHESSFRPSMTIVVKALLPLLKSKPPSSPQA